MSWNSSHKRLVGGGGAAAIAFVCGGSALATALIIWLGNWIVDWVKVCP